MNYCVLDIETAPLDEAEIPSSFVAKLQSGDESEDWTEKLGLYALSASVVVIGLLNPHTRRGELIYDDRHGLIDSVQIPDGYDVHLVGAGEAGMLEHFWASIARFDCTVTYNGRGFDIPFLMQRSLIRGIPVSTNLMGPRFTTWGNHLDLADLLSLYRATRMFGLAGWTEAIGEESPKEGEVSGAEVGPAFHAGRVKEIAEYCFRDVISTAHLFQRMQQSWQVFLDRR